MERVEVLYTGRVQGVGFRWTACEKAKGLLIDGWVKNLPDGTVQMVVEGERPQILELIDRIARQMGGNIHSHTMDWQTFQGGIAGFSVRK